MQFSAKNILNCSSHKAPQEYWGLDGVLNARPRIKNTETSLQELDGCNVVAWFVRGNDGIWRLASEFFIVTKCRPLKQKGAQYKQEKITFVTKYREELENIRIRNFSAKHPTASVMIKRARKEVGYSQSTSACDILTMIISTYEKLFKQ